MASQQINGSMLESLVGLLVGAIARDRFIRR